MTFNFPGPQQLEIQYTTDTITHRMNLNLSTRLTYPPGTDFSDVDVTCRDSSFQVLDTLVDEYVALLKPLFTGDTTIDRATLYNVEPESFVRTWVGEYAVGEVGTHAGVYTPASEFIITFRTVEGGVLRFQMEEIIVTFYGRYSAASMTPGEADANMRDYYLAADSWILARDTSYPISAIYALYGQNERIFRIRYR